jgi:hypothetical protein
MVKNKNAKHLLISKQKRYEKSAYFIKRWDVAPTNMKKKTRTTKFYNKNN